MNDRGAVALVVPAVVALSAGAVTWVLALQIPGVSDSSSSGTVIAILSAAVSAETGLIGWMVKQLFSGNWVRADVSDIIKQHQNASKALTESADTNRRLIEIAFGGRQQRKTRDEPDE